MNKGSDRVEGKRGDGRSAPAPTQDTTPAARAGEQVAAQPKQKVKAGTSARKRRAPFVL